MIDIFNIIYNESECYQCALSIKSGQESVIYLVEIRLLGIVNLYFRKKTSVELTAPFLQVVVILVVS